MLSSARFPYCGVSTYPDDGGAPSEQVSPGCACNFAGAEQGLASAPHQSLVETHLEQQQTQLQRGVPLTGREAAESFEVQRGASLDATVSLSAADFSTCLLEGMVDRSTATTQSSSRLASRIEVSFGCEVPESQPAFPRGASDYAGEGVVAPSALWCLAAAPPLCFAPESVVSAFAAAAGGSEARPPLPSGGTTSATTVCSANTPGGSSSSSEGAIDSPGDWAVGTPPGICDSRDLPNVLLTHAPVCSSAAVVAVAARAQPPPASGGFAASAPVVQQQQPHTHQQPSREPVSAFGAAGGCSGSLGSVPHLGMGAATLPSWELQEERSADFEEGAQDAQRASASVSAFFAAAEPSLLPAVPGGTTAFEEVGVGVGVGVEVWGLMW